MNGICRQLFSVSIRLCRACNLIFFVSGLLTACQSADTTGITVRWDDNRATGLLIPRQQLPDGATDSPEQRLSVRLAGNETAILGAYQQLDDAVIFEPLVPFTRGLQYTVWFRNIPLGAVTIPPLASDDRPALLAIYPSPDTLPENLLKIYLHFSRPMREGKAQQYVALLKNGTDTLPGVFLDLQPELWNPDRTLLTLWLDPGRIKRDLQPNKQLGTPLQTGAQYQLVISPAWPDAQGATLGQRITKSFRTIPRDSLSPNPSTWLIRPPKAGSRESVEVNLGESLDYSLLTETIHIFDGQGRSILGNWLPDNEERRVAFKPDKPWQAGAYRLNIESRLEDLAGNNLNRPFDRDITRKNQSGTPTQPYAERLFRID